MSSRSGVRAAMVGIFAVLTMVIVVAEVRSQPRLPGVPPRPMPPRFQRPSIPRPTPSVPSFPAVPPIRPPSIGNPGSRLGGIPHFEEVWTCGKCNAELGRGSKPNLSSCPHCGARFINGGVGFTSTRPPAMGAPSLPAASSSPNPLDPDLAPRLTPSAPYRTSPAPQPATPEPNPVGQPEEEAGLSETGSLVLKLMLVAFGVIFLLLVAGGALVFFAANRSQKGAKPRRKTRSVDLD